VTGGYRIAITLTAPGSRVQASSSYAVFAPGDDAPIAYAACVFGDADGARAEAEGRAAVERHAARCGRAAASIAIERTAIHAKPIDAPSPAMHQLVVLTDELDALSARVKQRYPDEVTCRKGCDACCHQQVGISRVEAERVAAAIDALAPAARAALAATVRRATTGAPPPDVCGALDDDGGCQIYDGRPVVCRSHGLIYAYRTPTARGPSEPGYARSCALNFRTDAPVPLLRTKPPARDDRSYVHDSDAGSARLLAIDGAFVDELGLAAAPALDRSITLNALFLRLLPR
jgi:uncharacterized protein